MSSDQSIQFAASVALFNGPQVLLIKRARAPYQGFWTLPGGRAEPGESAIDCAKREIREELGLVLGDLIPALEMATPAKTGMLKLQVFTAFVDLSHSQAFVFDADEIADHVWVQAADLSALQTTPGLAEALDHASLVLRQTPFTVE